MTPPSAYDFVKLISATTWPFSAHSAVLKLGFISNVFVATALVDAYSKSKRMANAQNVFDEMPFRNAVAWNSLIGGYARVGSPQTSMKVFKEMKAAGIRATPFTISAVLLAGEPTGAAIHGVAIKLGFCNNVVVASSLVDTYAKYGYSITNAQKLFEEMSDRNTVTYTSLIIRYATHGKHAEAMELLGEMRYEGIEPNEVTISGVLAAFARTSGVVYGMRVHGTAIRLGIEADPFVSSALMSLYSRHGGVKEFAKSVVSDSSGDQVLQNSIITGNALVGNLEEAVKEFIRMKRRAMAADFYTFGSLVWAAGVGSALEEGKQIHAMAIKTGLISGAFVQNGLVAMYARCGEMGDSEIAFTAIAAPDRVSWNSLLSGYAMHGHGDRALVLFRTMRFTGVEPDRITFLSLISACGHVGLVAEGAELFSKLVHGAGEEHCSAIIDLLARSGHLEQAELLLQAWPSPSAFRALASSAKSRGDTAMAARAAARLLELYPRDTSGFVLVSNLLAEMDLWSNSAAVRKKMAEEGLKKEPGRSWIE
ncbi:pentatricopeptide repeat-containing protein DOT4, chloroplastic-like [Wolffia australiana]